MNTKVFIVNKGGHDFSSASSYGELVYLSEGSLNRYAVTNMYRQFAEILRHSTPDDYILLTGLTTMGVVACSIVSFMHGKLNLLLYKQGRYVDRQLVLGELLNNDYTNFEEEEEEARIDRILKSTGLTLDELEGSVSRIREDKDEQKEEKSN